MLLRIRAHIPNTYPVIERLQNPQLAGAPVGAGQDFFNAFYSVIRKRALEEFHKSTPGIVPFVSTCLGGQPAEAGFTMESGKRSVTPLEHGRSNRTTPLDRKRSLGLSGLSSSLTWMTWDGAHTPSRSRGSFPGKS